MADSGTGQFQRSPIRQVLMAMWGLALASSSGFAGDADSTDAARALPKAVPARINVAALGKPVIVSRADVESPLGRVRSLQLDASAQTGETRVADPAFKAVLLTPQESTGRPVQPIIPLHELTSGVPHSTPADAEATKVQAATEKAAPARPAKAQPTRTASKPPASRPTFAAPKQAIAGAANLAVAKRPTKPVEPKSAGGFGRSEIAATRAFTRF